MICKVALYLGTFVNAPVGLVARREAAESPAGEKFVGNGLHHLALVFVADRRMVESHGEELVVADCHILSVIIHIVSKIAACLNPEVLFEVGLYGCLDL